MDNKLNIPDLSFLVRLQPFIAGADIDVVLRAGFDILDLEIAFVSDRIDPLDA